MGMPNRKWIKLLVTTTIGRISVGKSIFFIRFPWATSTLADSKEDAENHTCQGRTPQKRKRAYSQGEPSNAGSRGIKIKPKTTV